MTNGAPDNLASDPNTTAETDLAVSASTKTSLRLRAAEKIRSELNIEKWPAIWQPAKSKNKPALRVMERETTAPDGSRIISRVEIGYTQLGTLTTEEQKMLYVLIKLWEDSGKPDSQVFFSSRALARLLKKKGWGTNVIEAITKSLRKLRTIPMEWINSYHDQTTQGRMIVDRRPLTLLGDLRIIERHQDGTVNSSQGYFKFNDNVLTNLQRNYTKPVCIDEFFKLRSEIAQLIYSHVDLIMFDKSKYERRTEQLFEDLGLKNAEYKHMYERKRAIEKALKELQGIRLSSGLLKSATIEKTADGKDYKVSFSKSAVVAKLEVEVESAKENDLPSPTVVINDFSKIKDPIVIEAEGLVGHFYKIFHGVESHYPQSKETDQALSLITQHGAERAKHILSFAQGAASQTHYTPQTFGGILQYTSRAIAEFEELQRRPVAVPAPSRQPEPLVQQQGESRLSFLTPEQYATRFAVVRNEMIQQSPALGRFLGMEKVMSDRLIRARMVRQLETEPMNLMKFSDLPEWARLSPNPTQNLPL